MGKSSSKRRRLAVPAILATAAIGGVALTSGAWFTDTATVDNNTFAAGTVQLGVNPGTAAITATNLVPGDVNYGRIDVSNPGTLELRYSVTQAATNADGKNLAGALELDVVRVAAGAACDASVFSGAPVLLNGADDKFATATVFGSKAVGGQAGDRVLASGASEGLCMRVTMPSGSANALQGGATTGTFTFDAEQTKNNA